MSRGSQKLNWWLVNKKVYVRKKRNILLRVVTSTQRLIIETLPEMAGFCRFWSQHVSTNY